MISVRIVCGVGALAFVLMGCGKAADSPSTPAGQPGAKVETPSAPATGSSSGSLGNFEEGGTLNLTVQGQPATIALDSVDLANTDEGYPDYLEIVGPGTYLVAAIEPKMPDEDDDAYYGPVVGRPFPMNFPLDILETPREITIPNQGKYPVIGGSVTMDKYQIGREGRDHWDGRVEVIIQTTQGPITLPGTFSFCVVPTW